MDENVFKRYLRLRYSDNTAGQYLSAFKSHAHYLTNQKAIDDFIESKAYAKTNNPFYKAFLKAYIDCFELPFNIVKSKRKLPKITKEYKFLTHKQIKHIINNTSPKISLLVRLFFETGLRLRELIYAEWNSIDLKERTIEGIGKNYRPFKVKFSGKSAKLLYVYLKKNKRKYPFWDNEDVTRAHARSFWYFLKKECREIDIPNVHPHKIRHALGHYLRADVGIDLQQIKVKLRHAKLQTTDIYTVATQKEVDDLIDRKVFRE